MDKIHLILLLNGLLLVLVGCSTKERGQQASETRFQLLSADYTEVSFVNEIKEDFDNNILDNEYLYNGGGVGIADFNKDGLQDLFFTGNMVTSRLYLNKGAFKFEDITASSGVETSRWATGVSIVDINADTWPDIYVSVSGDGPAETRKNYLFINNKDNTFSEKAASYGIADAGHTNHAVFFDSDRDGDLDLYLLNTTFDIFMPDNIRPRVNDGSATSNDRYYRNNGDGTYSDYTTEAGIIYEGHGLGVTVCDVNDDHWPDLYITNDYITNDVLYVNNGDGTFANKISTYLQHQSHYSMGNDVADVNNDGLQDILTLDMMPEDPRRLKLMSGGLNYDRFFKAQDAGYEPQYMRNMLHINNGKVPGSRNEFSFSDIGYLAGINNTDWSWAPLLADFDNDGHRDLYITNGFKKDVSNKDFAIRRFRTANQMEDRNAFKQRMMPVLDTLEGIRKSNYMFRNTNGIVFTDSTSSWGMDHPGFSNGAAYGDLDNDGDLEVIVNNIDEAPFIYKNLTRESTNSTYLKIRLYGYQKNTFGFGANIELFAQERRLSHYHTTYHGFQSSIDPVIHFGLKTSAIVDSILVTWPDGKKQLLTEVSTNQTLEVDYRNASDLTEVHKPTLSTMFVEVSRELGLNYTHDENRFVDFKYEPLSPHTFSMGGPYMAVGDLDGDGSEDVFIGGAYDRSAVIYYQQSGGKFKRAAFPFHKNREDMGSFIFDVDNDGDNDIYVASGGSEFSAGSGDYIDRLYINDGKGVFMYDSTRLPPVASSSGKVVVSDYDQDGDQDLFVAGRVYPGAYPVPVSSYIFENNNGSFKDVTEMVCPDLKDVGLVSDAIWTDFNADGWDDLVITGHWMPVMTFKNEKGKLFNVTALNDVSGNKGWWNSLQQMDIDNDGDQDLIAGNLGLNSKLKASDDKPLKITYDDMDNNGTVDAILGYYIGNECYPMAFRDQLFQQIGFTQSLFKKHESFAVLNYDQLIDKLDPKTPTTLKATELASCAFENIGGGKFEIRQLPLEAQIAPVNDILVIDVNKDGFQDLLLVGNSNASDIFTGLYDAYIGQCLINDGKGGFTPMSLQESGFFVESYARTIVKVNIGSTPAILVASNNGPLKAFMYRENADMSWRTGKPK